LHARTAHAEHCKVGLCGQAPSDDPYFFARILVHAGINSISVTPDSFLTVKHKKVAAAEDDRPQP
jgi:pyruvate, water dikinase